MTKTVAQRRRRQAAYAAREAVWCPVCHGRLKGRASRRTCSDRCRQIRCRGAARQRAMRLRAEPCLLPLASTTVRPISWQEARSVIERIERMPAQARFCFGLFFEGQLGGAVVYGDEYAENLRVWDRYGYSGRIICLSRGASLPWAPKGSASAAS